MTSEAGVAYKSIKYELCNLKAECTNLAKASWYSFWSPKLWDRQKASQKI